jgi:hypothetical protein
MLNGWSWKLLPTPGESTTTGTPASSSRLFGPTPLAWRICGVWMEPAAMMISFLALTVLAWL